MSEEEELEDVFIEVDPQADLANMVNELSEVDGLSSWESDFVISVSDWSGLYTPAQIEKIKELYDKHC